MKLLFVGNSITRHGPNAPIGWLHDWGMAASSRENDYVHQVMRLVHARCPDAQCKLVNIADWERDPATYDWAKLAPLRNYAADVLVMRVIENVPADQVRADAFGAQYAKLLAYLNPASHKRVLCSGSFWPNDQGDALIEAAAQREGYTFVSLRSLWANDANQALGLFGHAGVAGHPSDLGMRNIAQELFAALEGWLA